jgi:hypothetical protein
MLWPAALVALAAACLGLATALELRSAELFHEADEFNRSLTGSDPIDVETSDYFDSVWRLSGALHEVAGPLLAGAALAVLALLVVLALRWERRA